MDAPQVVGLLLVLTFSALMSYACVVEPLRAANLFAGRELYRLVHISTHQKERDRLLRCGGSLCGQGRRPQKSLISCLSVRGAIRRPSTITQHLPGCAV